MSSTRWSWPSASGSTRCAISCCARCRFGQDGSYSAEAIVNRVNAELANSFGNLAQRSLSMIFKNLDGVLPARGRGARGPGAARRRSRSACDTLAASIRALRLLGRARGVDERGVRLQRLCRRRRRPGRCARPIPSGWRRCSARWSSRSASWREAVAPVIPASADKLLDPDRQRAEGGAPIAQPTPIFPRLELAEEEAAA